MPTLSNQHVNFLGGEVSPRLYHRADLTHFGKWFSEAENLRFYETGAFRNRPGFTHISYTKANNPSNAVKLLAFSFNDEQSFLIELGAIAGVGYARFYKDGEPIMDGANPYEIASPFGDLRDQQIKYAQAGDILFLTNATYGTYELRRLKADGTEWEFKKFDGIYIPMGDINNETEHTLSLSDAGIASIVKIDIEASASTYSSNLFSPSFFINDEEAIQIEGETTWTIFVAAINTYLTENSYNFVAHLSEEFISFYNENNVSVDFPSMKISYDKLAESSVYQGVSPADYGANVVFHNSPRFGHSLVGEVTFNIPENAYKVLSIYGSNRINLSDYGQGYTSTEFRIIADENTQNVADSIQSIISQNNAVSSSATYTITVNTNVYINNDTSLALWYDGPSAPRGTFNAHLSYLSLQSVEKESYIDEEAGGIFFYLTDNNPGTKIFQNSRALPEEAVMVRNKVDAQEISVSYSSGGPYVSSVTFGNGDWRCVSNGNWSGNFAVEYSTNNQSTWNILTKISSSSDSIPNNMNESGVVEADDSVYFRIRASVTSGSVNIDFVTSSYYTNSYYKIVSIVSDNKAIVSPIKNHIGQFSNNNEWALSAFSGWNGYPSCVGFYQNRLFFGKDYILYGSAINDFWNFYRRAENVQDDDAIDMSLLSYKVNNIKNIVTQKSFFAFTEGAEFGIGSEGALTQADKFLKQMSSHGSSDCDPILPGDIIVFVDKSRNTVRALKYSLESDSYEATDISIFLRQLLENEEIVETDYSYTEKECYFLTASGTIYIMKYLPEQNILSWSHWQHARYTFKGIRVVKNGYKDDLYVLVANESRMAIEKLTADSYLDSAHAFNLETASNEITTPYSIATEVEVLTNDGNLLKATTDENGVITLAKKVSSGVYGLGYISKGTLLTPTILQQDQTYSTYIINKPFKVHFFFTESHGFKVGVEEHEKMQIEWQHPTNTDMEDELSLTSGHKSV